MIGSYPSYLRPEYKCRVQTWRPAAHLFHHSRRGLTRLILGFQDYDPFLAAYPLTMPLTLREPQYRFLHAEAATYLSSSKGVMRAALQADAITFKRNVKPLIKEYPRYQGGVGHTFMGAFYLATPWPVQDLSKAQVCKPACF